MESRGGWRERQKKWQGKRLTHTAPVATLLAAATGSSSIKWQDIFYHSIISTEVTAEPNHHRYHQQGSSTHDWIALNEQKDIFLWCQPLLNHVCQLLLQNNLNTVKKKKSIRIDIFLTDWLKTHQHQSLAGVWLTRNSCFCKAVLCAFIWLYRQLQTTKQQQHLHSSLGAFPRRMSAQPDSPEVPWLISCSYPREAGGWPPLKLLKTVNSDRHEKRGVHVLTKKNLCTAETIACKWKLRDVV